jgi:hypothetical protein
VKDIFRADVVGEVLANDMRDPNSIVDIIALIFCKITRCGYLLAARSPPQDFAACREIFNYIDGQPM